MTIAAGRQARERAVYTKPQTGPSAPVPTNSRPSCRECGAPTSGEFCGQTCKTAWNNRRKKRGAVLYDLFMTLRFERAAAAEDKLWTLVCRLASDWRREDLQMRDGRRSWRRHKRVLAEHPQIKSHMGRI